MKAFVFDIETRPDSVLLHDEDYMEEIRDGIEPAKNLKDPVKIAADIDGKLTRHREQMALHPTTGSIVSIGVSDLESTSTPDVYMGDNEAEILEQFCYWMRTHASVSLSPIVTGFNIRQFDLPFVTFRCAVHGVELPEWWPDAHTWGAVFDPMDLMGREKKPLHAWLRAFSLPPKAMSGKESLKLPIGPALEEYNRQDVSSERALIRALRPYTKLLRQRREKKEVEG